MVYLVALSWDILILEFFYVVFGAFLGVIILGIVSVIIPKIMGKMTPNINEEKEIVRGNVAVATYYGMITQAVIIGISLIIAAAIIAAIL